MRSLMDHFLIAMPSMGDPNFNETVTYVCKHDEEGAIGIIVNRPTDMRLEQVFEQLSLEVTAPETESRSATYQAPSSERNSS